MQAPEEFTGLGMPVFTAFGWAGEETAQNYAYSQLEQFIYLLHAAMATELQEELPFKGLSPIDHSVYLAAAENVEDDVHIAFNARPLSLEIQLALTDKSALNRALKQITKNPQGFLNLLRQLDPNWEFRIQQVQVDEENGDRVNYQDLYKGAVAGLDEEGIVELVEKTNYLNSDEKWVTPIYLSLRTPSDQAAAMQGSIIPVMSERINLLDPIVSVLLGSSVKKGVAAKVEVKKTAAPEVEKSVPPEVLEQAEKPLSQDEFTYISELMPLHIDRGFVNMTPEYWPFFAINARTESRPVTVIAGSIRDEDSAVWRLQPNDLARLVLGSQAHRWLEDTFVPGDYVQIMATRISDSEIHVVLKPLG
ncbi:MAG: hypothetical protein ACK2T4_01920 [Candidatus Promineifilaceae bacterium]|jgi:hypothetical protein